MATLLDALYLFETAGLFVWLREIATGRRDAAERVMGARFARPPMTALTREAAEGGKGGRTSAGRPYKPALAQLRESASVAAPNIKNALTKQGGRGIISAEGTIRPKTCQRYVAERLGEGSAASLYRSLSLTPMSQMQPSAVTPQRLSRASPPFYAKHTLGVWGDEPLVPFRDKQFIRDEGSCQEQLPFAVGGDEMSRSMPGPRMGEETPAVTLAGSPDLRGVPPPAGRWSGLAIDYDAIYYHIERRLGEAMACSAEGV